MSKDPAIGMFVGDAEIERRQRKRLATPLSETPVAGETRRLYREGDAVDIELLIYPGPIAFKWLSVCRLHITELLTLTIVACYKRSGFSGVNCHDGAGCRAVSAR